MQAVLLAAGVGQRLGIDRPKCLLEIGGKSLLKRHFEALESVGIDKLFVVTGHLLQMLAQAISQAAPKFTVEQIYNPNYRQGSAVSLVAALQRADQSQPLLLMDADVLYDPSLLTDLARAGGNALLIDPDFEPGPEPVKVCIKDGQVVEFSKSVDSDLDYDQIGESVGFFRIASGSLSTLAGCCDQAIVDHGVAVPHETALRDGMLSGQLSMNTLQTNARPWLEIDFPQDIERAINQVLPAIDDRG